MGASCCAGEGAGAANGHRGEENARGSVSRVLSIRLGARLRRTGRPFLWETDRSAPRATYPGDGAGTKPICRPYSVLLPVGFTVPAAVAGAAVGSYPTLSPLPHRDAAVCFLWHFPWGRPRRVLPGTVVPWSPDFPPSFAEASQGQAQCLPFVAWRRRAAARPSGLPYLVCPRSRSKRSWSRIARHSPSIVPSISSGRKRRWKATVAASLSRTS